MIRNMDNLLVLDVKEYRKKWKRTHTLKESLIKPLVNKLFNLITKKKLLVILVAYF